MNHKRLLLLFVAIVLVSLEIVHVFATEESIGERPVPDIQSVRERPAILRGPDYRVLPHRTKQFSFLYDHVAYKNLSFYEDMVRSMTEEKSRFIPIEEDTHVFIAPGEFKAMSDMYLSNYCKKKIRYPSGTARFGEFCWYEVDLDRVVRDRVGSNECE